RIVAVVARARRALRREIAVVVAVFGGKDTRRGAARLLARHRAVSRVRIGAGLHLPVARPVTDLDASSGTVAARAGRRRTRTPATRSRAANLTPALPAGLPPAAAALAP